MSHRTIISILLLALLQLPVVGTAQTHPSLILTRSGVAEIKRSLSAAPLFEKTLQEARNEVDAEIKSGIEVPVPKDMAGGYTHERHKKNFLVLQKTGVLFQVSGDKKYAVYIRDMLLEYAKLYPTLPLHPTQKSYATGKIFWQCLNDANWLVYVSQAYDCIYDWLKPEERKILERDLFRPFADFLSAGSPQFFNRVHNHSTWGNAAVGMIGLVMRDEELIERALHGLKGVEINDLEKDNDGGLIKLPGHDDAGFFAQLDFAFSPDGYYTEGPYYQRYAIYPFIIFAKALANNRPDLKIFQYRNDLLQKTVYALLQQTDGDGVFFPINDAQKGMSVKSRELVAAVDIVYADCGRDASLLSIVEAQGRVELNESGFRAALALAKGGAKPFQKQSMELRDGADGSEGALGILRSNSNNRDITAVFKYTAQGLGHGHFDKLSLSVYDGATEMLQDYGAARWVNIDQKAGGRYLPENDTWAKQSIAHNTVVVDERSHFNGDFETGNKNHSDHWYFNANNPGFQVASAKEVNAYPGVELHRTVCLIKDSSLTNPILVDVFAVHSDSAHQYDLPYQYKSQILSTDFKYTTFANNLVPLGTTDGYQHIWKEAAAALPADNFKMTWFTDGKFFSLTALNQPGDSLLFCRPGANDPDFNLRREPFVVHRKKNVKDVVFVSVIEPHGAYTPVVEMPADPYTHIRTVQLVWNDRDYTIASVSDDAGHRWTILLANRDASGTAEHTVTVGEKKYRWTGAAALQKSTN